MSEINKIYKQYGEFAGRIYLTIYCSSLAGFKELNDQNNQEAIALFKSRVSSYINQKYGVGFLDSYDQFFRDNHDNKKLVTEVTNRHSEFISKAIVDVIVAPVHKRESDKTSKVKNTNGTSTIAVQKTDRPVKQENSFKENDASEIVKTNPQEAIRIAKAAVFRNPQNAKNWCLLGEIYTKVGNWEEAIKSYSKALEKDPKLVEAEKGKAGALEKLNAMKSEPQEQTVKSSTETVSSIKISVPEKIEEKFSLNVPKEENQKENSGHSTDSAVDEFGSVTGVIPTAPAKTEVKTEPAIPNKEEIQRENQVQFNDDAVDPSSLTGMIPTDVMRRYGNAFLRLLDEKTRADAYRVIEKIEPKLPEAGVVLGQYYLASNMEEAKRHFKFAADAGIAEGKWGYAYLLPHSFNPNPGNPDDDEWERICLEAAEGECADAAHEMGNICHRRGAVVEAAYWYVIALSLGHKEGTISVKGITDEWINNGKPVAYNAGTKNYTNARHRAAVAFLRCYVGDNEIEEAKWAFDANPDKMLGYYLGRNYELIKKEYDTSFSIYERLKEYDYPYAVDRYGMHVFQGRGTKKDFDKGVACFRKSAENGCISAAESMGALAKTEKDYLTAAYWYAQGYARGDEMCGERLAELKNIMGL